MLFVLLLVFVVGVRAPFNHDSMDARHRAAYKYLFDAPSNEEGFVGCRVVQSTTSAYRADSVAFKCFNERYQFPPLRILESEKAYECEFNRMRMIFKGFTPDEHNIPSVNFTVYYMVADATVKFRVFSNETHVLPQGSFKVKNRGNQIVENEELKKFLKLILDRRVQEFFSFV